MEFKSIIIGYSNRIKKKYEIARFQSYFSIVSNLDKKDKNKSINNIIPLSWEKGKSSKNIEYITVEEFEDLKTKFNFLN